jgi:sialidase-1
MLFVHDPQFKPEYGTELDLDHPRSLGLRAQWGMLAGGGVMVDDQAGSNPLSMVGGVSWAGGPDGYALTLNGTSGYLRTATTPLNPAAGDFTASIWFRCTAGVTAQQNLYNQEDGTGIGRAWLYIVSSHINAFFGGVVLAGATVLAVGAWYHAVVRVQGNVVTLFLNGVQDAQGTRTIESCDGAMRVGNSKVNTVYLNGQIGRTMRVWVRALADQEVVDEYRRPNELFLSSPLSWWLVARPAGGVPGGALPALMASYRRRRTG